MFGLLTVLGYAFSRWSWVWRVGCTHSFFGAHGESDAADACLKGFSVTKSALLAAILSASDGAAALRHINPEKHRRLASLLLGEVSDIAVVIGAAIYTMASSPSPPP